MTKAALKKSSEPLSPTSETLSSSPKPTQADRFVGLSEALDGAAPQWTMVAAQSTHNDFQRTQALLNQQAAQMVQQQMLYGTATAQIQYTASSGVTQSLLGSAGQALSITSPGRFTIAANPYITTGGWTIGTGLAGGAGGGGGSVAIHCTALKMDRRRVIFSKAPRVMIPEFDDYYRSAYTTATAAIYSTQMNYFDGSAHSSVKRIEKDGECLTMLFTVSASALKQLALSSSATIGDRLTNSFKEIYWEQASEEMKKETRKKFALEDALDISIPKEEVIITCSENAIDGNYEFRFTTYVVYYDPDAKAIDIVIKQTIKANLAAIQVDKKASRKLIDLLVSDEEKKARETLRDLISESDWRRYVTNGFLMVKGPKTGYFYQIFSNHKSERLRVYENGKMIHKLCIHTDSICPPTDHVINMKVLVECDEDELWKGSNKYAPDMPVFSPKQIAARNPKVISLVDRFEAMKKAA